ncbi:CapA family protein [Glutamicibacter halophytocola]|uniref:CapA family protein n=1 Tax=Glutamicibacter halophytocola TaxID=1933880 RepID=UPI00321B84DA
MLGKRRAGRSTPPFQARAGKHPCSRVQCNQRAEGVFAHGDRGCLVASSAARAGSRPAAKSGNGKDYDFSALLAGLKPYANDADAALCNLETPIGTPPYSGYPRFTVPAQILSDLKSIGYDGCTTATNHTVDAGTSGVNRTLDALEEQELFATGSYRGKKEAQEPPIMQIDGIKLGVIASTFSLNGLPEAADWQVDTGVDAQKLIQRGKSARQDGADVVVAAIHDGTEYSNRPTAQQRKLGRELAESGVFDFIYMHHTHSAAANRKTRWHLDRLRAGKFGGQACDKNHLEPRRNQRQGNVQPR